MSKSRTISRNIQRQRQQRAVQIGKQCPVCGCTMKPVWYNHKTRKCPECKTIVRVPWIVWR